MDNAVIVSGVQVASGYRSGIKFAFISAKIILGINMNCTRVPGHDVTTYPDTHIAIE